MEAEAISITRSRPIMKRKKDKADSRKAAGNKQIPDTIRPARVRYIKLGEGGRWEKECLEKRIIRIGFGSAQTERFELCQAGRWMEVFLSFIAEGKGKGTATRSMNEPGSSRKESAFEGSHLMCQRTRSPAAAAANRSISVFSEIWL